MRKKLLFPWLYTDSLAVKKVVKKMKDLGISERVISVFEGDFELEKLQLGELKFKSINREIFSKDEFELIASCSDYIVATFVRDTQKVAFYQCFFNPNIVDTTTLIEKYTYKVVYISLEELSEYAPPMEKTQLEELFKEYQHDILQKKELIKN